MFIFGTIHLINQSNYHILIALTFLFHKELRRFLNISDFISMLRVVICASLMEWKSFLNKLVIQTSKGKYVYTPATGVWNILIIPIVWIFRAAACANWASDFNQDNGIPGLIIAAATCWSPSGEINPPNMNCDKYKHRIMVSWSKYIV